MEIIQNLSMETSWISYTTAYNVKRHEGYLLIMMEWSPRYTVKWGKQNVEKWVSVLPLT